MIKQPFQLANELIEALDLPDHLDATECRTLDSRSPNLYINDTRVLGGKPAMGRNVIRSRKMRTKDLLQSIPTAALRSIHAAVCNSTE